MDQPLISIVMPTYNHAIFIGEAISSVLNQTYTNFELLVIDNFSMDETAAVAVSFHDERVKYERFANRGIIAASRNLGIKKARGGLVAFIDSDDVWQAEKLTRQVDDLQSKPKVALSFCAFRINSDDEAYKDKLFTASDKKLALLTYEMLLKRNYIPNSAVLVRKNALEEAGCFDES